LTKQNNIRQLQYSSQVRGTAAIKRLRWDWLVGAGQQLQGKDGFFTRAWY